MGDLKLLQKRSLFGDSFCRLDLSLVSLCKLKESILGKELKGENDLAMRLLKPTYESDRIVGKLLELKTFSKIFVRTTGTVNVESNAGF